MKMKQPAPPIEMLLQIRDQIYMVKKLVLIMIMAKGLCITAA